MKCIIPHVWVRTCEAGDVIDVFERVGNTCVKCLIVRWHMCVFIIAVCYMCVCTQC